jgi:hypothetical protein
MNSSRQYATGTDTRKAIAELDKGEYIRDDDITIRTVHMIFTKTDVPVDDGLLMGWEPGYLWPMDDVSYSLSVATEKEYQDEAITAIHDLHNIRPRHPIVHYGHRTNNWYYNSCDECDFDTKDITLKQRIDARSSDTRLQWNGINFEGKEVRMHGDNTLDYGEGMDHLCVCTHENALQPPQETRGEVARALLYMNLRYGTSISDDAARRRLNAANLDLALTDCHPLVRSDDYDDDSLKQPAMNTIGYFSKLVEWHLEDPPSQREINRNDAICQNYQGNRNPFVDFYEESWALLDFERLDREVCAGNTVSYGKDDDDGYVATEKPVIDDEIEKSSFGCAELMPGDISFYMVQPSSHDGSTDLSHGEEWQRETFGLVTLVDLEPGLILYVAGVDDEASQMDGEGGVLKLEVPERGIPTGSYFGYGNRIYLGNQWEPILEDGGERSVFRFSVHQLYLYCACDGDDSGISDEYKILAALSTTGRSFGTEGLPTYWERFQNEHSNIKLSEYFSDRIHYGLIVLPEDASDPQDSGGYRYVGPTYTKHDMYAKALINEAHWKRINRLDSGESIYESTEETPEMNSDEVDAGEVESRLDGSTIESNSSGSGPRLIRNTRWCSAITFAGTCILLFANLS